MPPLYVVQQGAKLRINNRRVQVEVEEDNRIQVLAQIPIGQVSQVVLFGNIGLTTPAIDTLLGENIEVIFLTQQGEFRGHLIGELTPHVPLRRAQYRSLETAHFGLEMAKGFVRAKLQHQRALLQRHNRELRDSQIESAVKRLGEALGNVEHKTALTSLRGLEGAATAAYFSGFRRLFDPQWNFSNRLRRPPPDPVNVLLSLGYTLLGQLCTAAVRTVGLDPYAGYLHEVVYNRPALGLDLLEEFRPVIDGLALWACRSGALSPQDFSPGPSERPVIMADAARKAYITAFEQRLELRFTPPKGGVAPPKGGVASSAGQPRDAAGLRLSLRQCLIEQARQIAARVQSNQPGYTGMGFR